MLEMCDECEGSGKSPEESEEVPCVTCGGEGLLSQIICEPCQAQGCSHCNQEGYLYDMECYVCDCKGTVERPLRCLKCRGRGSIIPNLNLFKR
jgi:RecJ-like exonuclease